MSFLTAVDLPFQRIEALASAAFGPGSPELRAQANLELSGFSESIESLAICRQLLQSSQNMYALSLASSSLVELVTLHWFAIGQKELSNLQSYIFELLLNQLNCNDGNYPIYVKNNLIRVLGRITKLGLCRDGEHHRKFMRHLISVASQRVEYQLLVFTILIEIITEVNEKSKRGQTVEEFSSLLYEFKSLYLLEYFQLSLQSLAEISHKKEQFPLLFSASLELGKRCLTFKWGGACFDDTSENLSSIRIPDSWKETLENPATLELFFASIHNASAEDITRILECLVQLAACRQSVFGDSGAHNQYLNRILRGTSQLIANQEIVIQSEESYVQLCRLVLAIKSTYRIDQLGVLESYKEWVGSIVNFTKISFIHWRDVGKSIHFILSLWGKITHSIGFSRGEFLEDLEPMVPEIVKAYIRLRLEALNDLLEEDEESEFFEDALIEEHLSHLPAMARKKYSIFISFMMQETQNLLNEYENTNDFLEKNGLGSADILKRMRYLEGQLAWWIHIIAVTISGNSNDKEAINYDTEMFYRALQICSASQKRSAKITEDLSLCTTKYLDIALLRLFQKHFDSYILLSRTREIFKVLNSNSVQMNQGMFIDLILVKLSNSMRMWKEDPSIAESCLDLLEAIAADSESKSLLPNLAASSQIIDIGLSSMILNDPKLLKLRTKFYFFWGVIVFSTENMENFSRLMSNFDTRISIICSQIQNSNHPEFKLHVSSLYRDMRGLVQATSKGTSEQSYEAFFEWFAPNGIPITKQLLKIYAFKDSQITVSIMRFVCELVHNQDSRIRFPSQSPTGLVLFKYLSEILQVVSECQLSVRTTNIPDDFYKEVVKPAYISMLALDHAFIGDYVYFGSFAFYGDFAPRNAVLSILEIVSKVPNDELFCVKKVRRALYHMLETITRVYPIVVGDISEEGLVLILKIILQGVASSDMDTTRMACESLNNLLLFIVVRRNRPFAKPTQQDESLINFVSSSEDLLAKILQKSFDIAILENDETIRHISGLFFTSLAYFQPVFKRFSQYLVHSHKPEIQGLIYGILSRLETQVRQENNFTSADSRSKFLTRMFELRREILPHLQSSR